MGELFRCDTLRHHVARHVSDVARTLSQCLDRFRVAYRRTDLAQTDTLQSEQVFFRDQAHQLFALDDQHVPETLPRHQQGRLMRQGLRRQAGQLRTHDVDDRLIQVDLRNGDAVQYVMQGDDT